MGYLKSLFFNFILIFFANSLIPGVEILKPTKLPHIQGDLIFAFCLAFLLSLIFPFLKIFRIKPDASKIAIASFCISFVSYALINFLPLEIEIKSFMAYFWVACAVFFTGFITNFLEEKRARSKESCQAESLDHLNKN
jgi:hypothetical protein